MIFYWYGGRRSKPRRPSRRNAKQLEVVDAVMRRSTDSEEENTCEDQTESENQTESGNATRTLSEYQESVTSVSTLNTSSDSTLSASPTSNVSWSSDVTTSNN